MKNLRNNLCLSLALVTILTAHRVYGCIGAHFTENKVGNADVVYSLNDGHGEKLDRIIFRKAVGSREITLETENRRRIKVKVECGKEFCIGSFPHGEELDQAKKLTMIISGRPPIKGLLNVPILTRSLGGGQKTDPDKILDGMKDCGGNSAAKVFQNEGENGAGGGHLQ
jgi:hypothetical protein